MSVIKLWLRRLVVELLKGPLTRPSCRQHNVLNVYVIVCKEEDEAALVLWPLNLDVSTPAVDKTVLHHLEIVSLLTGPCGFT